MADDVLITSVDNNVGTVMLNRPEKRNALSPELLVKLHMQLEDWAKQSQIRAVVIRGSGDKAFSSGFDIFDIPTNVSPEMQELLNNNNPLELALNSVVNFPYPVIAMVNGYAFGAGMNLAICCDIRLGAIDIKMGMPPAKLGVVYPPQGLSQFIQVVGMARTREIFLTAKTYTGQEAKEVGMINYLYDKTDLIDKTYAMAHEIAVNAPLALKGIKRILNLLGNSNHLDDKDIKECENLVQASFKSEDLKEGQTAFIEKRKPVFKGF